MANAVQGDAVAIGWYSDVDGPGAKVLCEQISAKMNFDEVKYPMAISSSAEIADLLKVTPPENVTATLSSASADLLHLLDRAQIGTEDTLVVQMAHDERRLDMTDKKQLLNVTAVEQFLLKGQQPVMIDYDSKMGVKVSASPIKQHVLLAAHSGDPHFKSMRDAMVKAGEKHRGQAIFMTMDAAQDDTAEAMKFLKLSTGDLPVLLAVDWQRTHSANKYYMQGAITESALMRFMEMYFAKKVKPDLTDDIIPRMQPLELHQQDGIPVKTVATHNFKEIVMDPKRDVMLELYDGSVSPVPG